MAALIKIKLLTDNTGFSKGLRDADNDLSGLGSKVASVGAAMGKVALAAGAAFAVAGVAVAGALFKIGSDWDSVSDTIAAQTGATGKSLDALNKNAENVLKNTPASMDDTATAIAGVTQKLGLGGKELEKVSSSYLNLTDMIGGDLATHIDVGSKALSQFKVAPKDSEKALDTLFKVTQTTGIGFDELSSTMQSSGNQLQQLGFGFDESAALIGKLSKSGVNVSDVMGGMSKGLATLAKAGEEPKAAFARLTEEIKTTKDPVEASQKAMELFGAKAGPKLAEDIRNGALSVGDLTAQLDKNTSSISGTAASTWDWKEKLDLLKNKVLVQLRPVAEKVFNAVGTVIEKVTPYLEGFSGWLADKIPIAIAFVEGVVSDLVKVFQDRVLPVLQAVASFVVDTLVPGFVSFGEWLVDHKPILIGVAAAIATFLVAAFASWAVSAGAAAVATLLAIAPVLLVGAAIAGLVAGIIWAYQNVDWFRTAIQKVGSFLKDTLWPIIQQVASAIWDGLGAAVSWLSDLWTGTLWPALQVVIAWVQDSLWPVLKAIAGFLVDVLGAAVSALAWVWSEVLWPVLKSVVGFITGTIIPAIGTFIGWVVAIATKVGEVAWAIGTKIGEIVGFVVGLPGRIADTVSNLWNGFKIGVAVLVSWVGDRWTDLVNGVTSIPDRIKSAASGMWDGIKDAFRGALNFIIRSWNNFGFKFPTIDVPIIGKVGGWSFDTPNIPELAAGGIARARPGGHVVRVAEAGQDEVIAPLDKLAGMLGLDGPAGNGGTVINIEANTNASAASIGAEVAWALKYR